MTESLSEPLYVEFMSRDGKYTTKEEYLNNPKKICRYFDTIESMEAYKQEFFDFIDNQKKVDGNRCLGVDIETSKRDGRDILKGDKPDFRRDRLSIIQVSNTEQTWVFNINNLNKGQFKPFITKLCEIAWAGHNIKFDCKFVHRDYHVRPSLVFDTENAAKNIIVEPNRSYNFQTVAKEYMQLHLPKEEQIANWGSMLPTTSMIAYAARDAYYSFELKNVLTTKLNEITRLKSGNINSRYITDLGVYHKLFHLEMECLLIFIDMENYGFHLDRKTLQLNCDTMDQVEKDHILTLLDEVGYKKFNPRSPKQIKELFATHYPESGRYDETEKFIFLKDIESVDKEHLKPFIKLGLPLVDKIYDFKALTGQVQRLEEFEELIDESDRVYPDFRLWGTVTSRTSCKKPNLQNIKNKSVHGVNLKALFEAPFGKELIVVDFSQIQLIIIAALTHDPVMKDVIINGPNIKLPMHEGGLDLHISTAAAVTGKAWEEITKDERKRGKPLNFGFCFGMSWASFIDYAWLQYDVRFDKEGAKDARNAFFSLYKGIDRWHKNVLASSRGGTYYCRSIYGRDMKAFKFTDATNYPVQATEALILKMSLVLIKNELVKKNLLQYADLVNIVHDEVVYEVEASKSEEVFEIVCRNMSEAGRVILNGALPVRVEGHIVKRWSEAK